MQFLPEAVDSILKQTFQDFELIVLDDGSIDKTASYVNTISDSRLQYIYLEKGGIVQALNHGLGIASADLIARMDADDIAMPTRIAEQHAAFECNPGLVVCSTMYKIIDEKNTVLKVHTNAPKTNAAIRFYTLFSPPFLHPGAMFRRRKVLDIGGYASNFKVAQDHDLWARLLPTGNGMNLDKVLMSYRFHQQMTGVQRKQLQCENSTVITGQYAANMVPEIEAKAWEAVRKFAVNQPLPASEVANIPDTFAIVVNHFMKAYPSTPELVDQIKYWRARLAYRAGLEAKQALRGMRGFVKWLKLRRKLQEIGSFPTRSAI